MEATFHISDDLDIEVRSQRQGRTVDLCVIAGEDLDFDKQPHRRRQTTSLSPSTARALASALMGAAAEV